MPGAQKKSFTDYITTPAQPGENILTQYSRKPATTFLIEAIHIGDSINHCIRHFPKKSDGAFNKDSQDSLFRLSAASLAALMGHFETFQKFLFAGVIRANSPAQEF